MCLSVMLLAVFVVSPFLAVPGAKGSFEDLFSGVTTLIAPYSTDPPVDVDGRISPGEYDSNVTYTTSVTGISVHLLHDNESLFVGIQGPSWRWVALGISSDEGSTMGFVVVARAGSGSAYMVQERLVTNISEEMTFSSPGAGRAAVEEFESTLSGNDSVAELQLSLESSLWSLGTGVIYPTVVASNMTAPFTFPAGVSSADANFAGSYLLRPDDNVKNVNEMLNGEISPVPSVIAAAILAVGVVAIFTEFVVRRRKE
jgi:hypothetical protein